MIHWTWIIFSLVVIFLIGRIWWKIKQPKIDYGFNLESPLLIIVLIAFVLIWGGIFWW